MLAKRRVGIARNLESALSRCKKLLLGERLMPSVFSLVFIGFFASNSLGQTNGSSKGPSPELIGAYISAADMYDKIKQAGCDRYAKKNKLITKEMALTELRARVSDKDYQEIVSHLQTDEMRRKFARNTDYVENFLRLGIQDGAQKPFLCGLILGMQISVSQPIENEWRRAGGS